MMIAPIQSMFSKRSAPHLAPLASQAEAVLVLWSLCLMGLRDSGGTYP